MDNELKELKEYIMDRIYKDTFDHFRRTSEPMKLGILAQRYNRKAAKLGVDLIDLISADPRYIVKVNAKGGRLIVVHDQFMEAMENDPGKYWQAFGVPLF